MNTIRRAGLATLALCLVTHVAAGVKTHEVTGGDSVSSIAKHYYGSFDPTDHLLRFNDKSDPVIHVGEKLKIPYSEIHRVESGDTWSVLSDRYLGSSSAYRSIALLNDLSPDDPLQVGQEIVMPVGLPYRLARGDTLAKIAQRFYGDHERAAALQAFNGIDDPRRLSVGQAIEIPLTTLRLAQRGTAAPATKRRQPARTPPTAPEPEPEPEPAPPPAAKPQPTPEPDPEPRFQNEIDQARRAFRHGEFERARELVESLRGRVNTQGTDGDRTELLELQTFVYVAFDLPHRACNAYLSLIKLDPGFPLSPQTVSPKIRETLAACL